MSNNTNTSTQDPEIEQDLASIAQAVENYVGNSYNRNHGSYDGPHLPSKLSQLDVSLNYNPRQYLYKVLEDDGGETNLSTLYEICANFNSNTFRLTNNSNPYYADATASGNTTPDTLPDTYSAHSQGEQCFTDDIGGEANGIVYIVPNTNESQYRQQILEDNMDWPANTPVNLPENK